MKLAWINALALTSSLVLGACAGTSGGSDPTISSASEPVVVTAEDTAGLQGNARLVLPFHDGERYTFDPSQGQIDFSRIALDVGADTPAPLSPVITEMAAEADTDLPAFEAHSFQITAPPPSFVSPSAINQGGGPRCYAEIMFIYTTVGEDGSVSTHTGYQWVAYAC